MSSFEVLVKKLKSFYRFYYFDKLIRGTIYFIFVVCFFLILGSFLAYAFPFSSIDRALLFYLLLFSYFVALLFWVVFPFLKVFFILKKPASKEIVNLLSAYFPEIKNKLVNILELNDLKNQDFDGQYLISAIEQKMENIKHISFIKSVKIKSNLKPFFLFIVPLGLVYVLLTGLYPKALTTGYHKILHYDSTFSDDAPFEIVSDKTTYQILYGEDLNIDVYVEGDFLPSTIKLSDGKKSFKIKKLKNNHFNIQLKNLKQNTSYHYIASGFKLPAFDVRVLSKPKLINFDVFLHYPPHAGLQKTHVKNASDLHVIEGTVIHWNFNTKDTDTLLLGSKEVVKILPQSDGGVFVHKKRVIEDFNYFVIPKNRHTSNTDSIYYKVAVIKDQHPKINVKTNSNTVATHQLDALIEMEDDFGFSDLFFHYKIFYDKAGGRERSDYKKVKIDFDKRSNYFVLQHKVDLRNLGFARGMNAAFYYEVFDNDGVNGTKSTRSQIFSLNMLSDLVLREQANSVSNQVSLQLGAALKSVDKLNSKIKNFENAVRQKNSIDFQDKQYFEEIAKLSEEINKQLERAKKNENKAEEIRDSLNEGEEPQEQENNNSVLEEELKASKLAELIDKLNELMKQSDIPPDSNFFQELNEEVASTRKNIDRQLELYKNALFDKSLEQLVDNIEKLKIEQEALSKKIETQNPQTDTPASAEQIAKEQKEIEDTFKALEKDMDFLKDLKEELNNKKDFEKPTEEVDEINKSLETLQQELEKNEKQEVGEAGETENESPSDPKEQVGQEKQNREEQQKGEQEKKDEHLSPKKKDKVLKEQEKVSQNLKKLKEKLEKMKAENKMEEAKINKQQLKQVLDGYLHASFEQEEIIRSSPNGYGSNDAFLSLVQRQKKLHDNVTLLRDSLFSLSKKLPKLNFSIVKESDKADKYLSRSIEQFEQRKIPLAVKSQKQAFTSLNEIALILSNIKIIEQLNMNNNSSGGGQNAQQQSIGQIKKMQQELQKNMEQAMKEMQQQQGGEQQGNEKSKSNAEKIAKMAMQQQMIREAMQELSKQLGETKKGNSKGQQQGGAKEQKGGEKGNGEEGKGDNGLNKNDIIKSMEEAEIELFNKKITLNSLMRQKRIETKLLEFEKALREKENSLEFESKSAKNTFTNPTNNAFDDYVKRKQKEVELIKTTPIKLTEFYKKKAAEYFNKIYN